MIIAPDNRHVAWTRIVSAFAPPGPIPGIPKACFRNGEVKQSVRGGTGISLAQWT